MARIELKPFSESKIPPNLWLHLNVELYRDSEKVLKFY